jgi:hypothetical protein
MKKLSLMGLLFVSLISIAQNKKATTEDGKKVILKNDNTWEYVDVKDKKLQTVTTTTSDCNLGADFVEKKRNEGLRKHVAVENDCNLEDIKFIDLTEGMGRGMYSLCVKGKLMKYKKVGTVFMRAEQDPLK